MLSESVYYRTNKENKYNDMRTNNRTHADGWLYVSVINFHAIFPRFSAATCQRKKHNILYNIT
jgi:hypothetical protein